MDIAFINFTRGKTTDQRADKNRLSYFFLGAFFTLFVLLIGYLLCIKLGLAPPISGECCFGVLELDFDFDFAAPD